MIFIIAGIPVFLIVVFVFIKSIVFISPAKGQNGIAALETVEIGGVRQTMLIRSEDISNPILLYLHSGPGTTELSAFRAYHAELERYFTVVVWEQRGTGKSYARSLTPETMTIDRMVTDTGEVIQYLLKRFDQQKLFLAGHSWGTLLGVLTAQRYPGFLYAYVGSGQEVCPAEGEKISYAYTLEKAKEQGNAQAVKELQQIAVQFEYLTIADNPNWYEELTMERKWLVRFGGEVHDSDNNNAIYVMSAILPSEYTLADFIRFAQGSRFSLKALWPQVMQVNLMESVKSLSIPVFFVQGRYDYNTPSSLVDAYYRQLSAPQKELIWMENSGHHALYEEAERYDSILIEQVLPLAR